MTGTAGGGRRGDFVPVSDVVEDLVRDYYPGIAEAAELLDQAANGETEAQRQAAASRLIQLDRERVLRDRARTGGPAALRDPDCWEEAGAAKARDVAAPAATRGPRFELAAAFLARVTAQPERPAKIRELWPGEGVFLRHGRPRSMKSFALLEECLAATSDSGPAFHCERFTVEARLRVAYLTEEDSDRVVRARLHWLMAGRGVTDAGALALLCRPGWNLETGLGGEELLAELRRLEPDVLVIDPARASLPGIDGGPKDGAAGAMLVRRILRETPVHLIGFGAHDTKPARDGVDSRARAERASGGVLFSLADAPIGFQRHSDRETLAWPSHYKQAADPKPFVIRFESGSSAGGFRDYVRLVAQSHEGGEESALASDQRDILLRLIDERAAVTTSEAEDALAGPGHRNGMAARHLSSLEAAGTVRSVTGKAGLAALAESLGRRTWAHNATVWVRADS